MIAVLDALAGASVLTVGILGWRRFRPTSVLALGAAVAWFAVPAVPSLALLHRPLLLHAVLALPGRGLRGILPRGVLVVAWIGVALPPSAQPMAALSTAAGCGVLAVRESRAGGPHGRPDEVASRRALLLLAFGMSLPVLERAVWPQYVDAGLPIATYLCAVILGSAVMLRGILAPSREEADAVIELSERTPAEALAQLKGLAGAERDSRRGRVLGSAVALLEENAELQDELAARVEEVRASRTRLIDASVRERQRLQRLLDDGAMRYLNELEVYVRSLHGQPPADATVSACLEEIWRTREDLDQLARGLHPRILSAGGLAPALEELARRSPVPAEVSVSVGRLPERIESAVWYACAEALANVWKHAQADRASIHVEQAREVLTATVHDDGVGGARMSAGGGLSGLVDRVSDVGGSLTLVSSTDGTDVTITVPLR